MYTKPNNIIVIKDDPKFTIKGHSLYFLGKSWYKPGHRAYSLVDTGNGYIFRDHHSNIRTDIGYCQMEGLIVLIKELKLDI